MNTEKKLALQKILEALVPYWDIAEWFLLLLQEGNDELMLALYDTIWKEIRNIKNKDQRQKINKALQEIKLEEGKQENKYLDDLISKI